MGCGCKKTPLQRIESKIQTRGFTKLAPSETAVLDAFIFDKLGEYPTSASNRIELYQKAKTIQ